MEVNFCENCDNLLYIYSDEENKSLYLGCKVCGEKKDYSDGKCIYSNEFNIDLSETINHNENLIYDITLPSIKDNKNIKCINQECESIKENKPSDILYIKYDHENLKYLYVCKYCNQKWKNN